MVLLVHGIIKQYKNTTSLIDLISKHINIKNIVSNIIYIFYYY
jgi:hypothetical protein